MTLIVWILLGIILAAIVCSWIIVMGPDPRKWKGGGDDGKR